MAKRKKQIARPADEDLIDRFTGVFHSYQDITRVSPIQLLKKLARSGVVLSSRSKRNST